MCLSLFSVCPSWMPLLSPGPTPAFWCSFRGQALIVCVCVCCRCGVCRCTLLPHCYTQMGDCGALVCSHHPADSQVTEPELWAAAENRLRGPAQAAPRLGGSAVSSAACYTGSIQSEDKLVSEAADMDRQDGEEARGEGADSRSGAPAVAAVREAPGPSEATLQQKGPQWSQELVGESAPTPSCNVLTSNIPALSPAAREDNQLFCCRLFISLCQYVCLLFFPLFPKIFVFLSTFCAQKNQPPSVPVQPRHHGG